MDTVSRDELKVKGIRRLIKSFKYAASGLVYAFRYEQNIIVHSLATIVVILMGIFFRISYIEATIDLITLEKHPLAKVAKDTAAAAVMVFALVAIAIGLIIFVPKIVLLFG